jgi:hypothetical protein
MMRREQEMMFLGILQILLYGKILILNILSLLRIAEIYVLPLPPMVLILIEPKVLAIAFGLVYVFPTTFHHQCA